MSPWRGYLLLLQDFAQWTGTHGGMIRSDLHGAESPTDGCCDLARGKEKPEVSTRKKEGRRTRDTPVDLDPWGFCLFSWTLTLESNDVIILTLTSPIVRVFTYDGQLCANWYVWQHSGPLEAKRSTFEA